MKERDIRVELNYGKSSVSVDIPAHNYLGSLLPRDVPVAGDGISETRRALANPIGSPRLQDLVSPNDRVVILVSDITRPCPSALLLPPLLEELNTAGVRDEQIKIIFGLGVHRKHTDDEKKILVGEDIFNRIECIDHDIDDCQEVGTSRLGTRAAVFKRVLDSDFIIASGNLEFHYFAGFSGGAKALAPGVCSRDTIESNHKRFLDPGAEGGRIEGNPLREELEEIAGMVGIDFLVNAVLDSHKRIIKVVAGDVTKAHREGAEYIRRMYGVEIKELADIVITSPGGFPKDINLYQTHKAMQNALPASKTGGIIIVVAQCPEGLGESHFSQTFEEGLSLQALADELGHKFIQGRHIASQIAEIQLRRELFLVTDMPEEIRRKLFVKCFSSLAEALAEAFSVQGKQARITVIPFGIATLPIFAE